MRDRWIGWDARVQFGRLKLIANNSRFLILPDWHRPNLGSKVLALCERRLPTDWLQRFGHPLLLLETFVDPQRFHGTVYRAANWTCVGLTQGFRRTAAGYSAAPHSPKQVFVRALHPRARQRLAQSVLDPRDHTEEHPKMTLTAVQMRALPESFSSIVDPRRAAGRRHPLRAVLAIAAGATLCGMRGYKAIGQWAQGLGQKGAQRIGCRRDPDTREYSDSQRERHPRCAHARRPRGTRHGAGRLECPVGAARSAAWPSTARPCAAPSTSRATKCT